MSPPVIAAVAAGAIAAGASAIGGATILGLSVALTAAVVGVTTVGLTMASQLLSPKINAPELPERQLTQRRLQQILTVRDPVRSHEIVYGQTRKGGMIPFWATTDGIPSELNAVIIWAGHQCQFIREIFFGEDLAFDSNGQVQPKYVGKAFIDHHLGHPDQPADAGLVSRVTRWTPEHRLRGRCYSVLRLRLDRDLFPGFPNVSAVIEGKQDIFDPRTSTTGWTDNPSLCIADYIHHALGAEYGTEIDEDELISSANIDDELVNVPDGDGGQTQEKRYTLHGIIDTADDPGVIIERMLTANHGSVPYSGGRFFVQSGAFRTPTVILDEHDLRGNLNVQPRIARRDLANAIRGLFVSEKNKYQPADFPPIISILFQAQDNGDRLWRDIELPFTATETMAQRIAKIELFKTREQITVTAPFSLKGLRVRAGDTVKLTNQRMGWNEKIFFVTDWSFIVQPDENDAPILGTQLRLRETSAAVFDITAGEQDLIDAAPDTDLPSPTDVEFWAVQLTGRGQFATSSVTSGFEAIRHLPQFRSWNGRFGSPSNMAGFIYNPATGHLNTQDQQDASGDNHDVFDTYVQDPFPNPSYETAEIAIDFDDVVRLIATMKATKGEVQDGIFRSFIEFDFRKEADAYAGFQPLRALSAEGMFFKFRARFDTTGGTGPILKTFTPAISKRLLVEKFTNESIPIGGKTFAFEHRYHNQPNIGTSVVAGAGRFVSLSDATKTHVTATIFDKNDTDVGGVATLRVEGV